MNRALILAIALAATPAAAFDIEKWLDKQTDKFLEEGRREKARELTHKDPQVRLRAVDFFSGNRDPGSIDALARVLASDTDGRVREAAASGLWRIEKAAEPARPQLMAALDDPDPNVVARAAGALQAMGMKEAELVAPRKRVLDSTNASVNARFLVSRNLIGQEPNLRLLVPMLAYLETQTRGYQGFNDPRRDNVELAQQALQRLVERTKDRDLIEPLMADLRRAHEGQWIIVKTLGFYNPKSDRWAETLVALLDSKRPKVRDESLTQMRTVKDDKDVRVWAPAAAALLQDPDSSVRSEALWALGAAGGLAANEVDKVVPMLGDPKEGVRRNAARALGEMGEQKQAVTAAAKARVATAAMPALTKAMESDPDKEVREEAKSALAKIGPVPASVAAGKPAPGPATPNYTSNPGSEAAGLAVLRARNVQFETRMYFKALGDADAELVRAFLDAGMSPKENLFELGPPMRAMLFSSTVCSPKERPTKPAVKEIIKLLLERGADINGADQHGNTALSEAASKGCDRETIRMMVKAGANINATNAAKLTPFEMGLWMGHDGLDELIAAGYRLPKNKVKDYTEGYKDRPASIAMIRKATPK